MYQNFKQIKTLFNVLTTLMYCPVFSSVHIDNYLPIDLSILMVFCLSIKY